MRTISAMETLQFAISPFHSIDTAGLLFLDRPRAQGVEGNEETSSKSDVG